MQKFGKLKKKMAINMINNNVNKKFSSQLPELTELRPVSFIRRKKRAKIVWIRRYIILIQLYAINVRKYVIILIIIWSQKTNLSFDDLFIDSWS